MPVRSARTLLCPLRLALVGLSGLVPLAARASDRDPAEIGHAIWFVGTFSIFFLGAMSLAIWLLVVRLRSGPATPEVAPHYPNLESVWAKEPLDAPAAPPSPPDTIPGA